MLIGDKLKYIGTVATDAGIKREINQDIVIVHTDEKI